MFEKLVEKARGRYWENGKYQDFSALITLSVPLITSILLFSIAYREPTTSNAFVMALFSLGKEYWFLTVSGALIHALLTVVVGFVLLSAASLGPLDKN